MYGLLQHWQRRLGTNMLPALNFCTYHDQIRSAVWLPVLEEQQSLVVHTAGNVGKNLQCTMSLT